METLFPQHFSENIVTQADQVIHAFDLMKKARADMAQQQTIPYQNMDSQMRSVVDETAWQQASAASGMLMGNLKNNIQSAAEAAKTTIDLDVNVNTEKISSDIRSAIQNAGSGVGEAMNLDLKMNEEQLASNLRAAISQVATGDEPVRVDIQINRESLKSDLSAALTEMDLPVKFKIDASELEKQIRSALDKIKDVKMDLHINTDALKQSVGESVTESVDQAEMQGANIHMPNVDTSNMLQFQQLMGNINAAGKQGKSVFESLGSTFKQAFSVYSGAYLLQNGINKVIQSGKKAISTVKEFNDIKTDLAMATGANKTYINDLMQDYNVLGKELGAITSDIALSADTWLRQGRSMSETGQLIKDSMVLSKDAQMDSEQAAEVLTATLNGFQMNADQASHINDVLNSIDLKSASDAGGIGQALTKVASQANNAGVSLEKTAAMIATIKDVTQDSDDSIGTGLKSIFSRMNQIKAGKFVDSETGESLNDVEKVLKKVGISMRDVNGQFKQSEPVIDEVAQKWAAFDGNTKKAVATAMAGTYQYNKLIAMFDNWNKVQMLTETAQNSDGTAQQKFEDNYLTSLEAKTNALKASLENVATGLVSDDMYAGFLDGAKAVADFTAQTDLLKASLAGLAAAGGVFAFQQLIALFKELSNFGSALNISKIADMSTDSFAQLLGLTQNLSNAQTKLVLSSTNLSNAQRIAILMNQGMSETQAAAAIASMGLATAEGTATAATFSLTGALSGLWATLMANPLVLVAAGVSAAVMAISSYSNSVKEAMSSAREAGNSWSEENASLEENISRIQELRTALESGTLTEQEAADAKSELLSIQESLTESYGDQVKGIDLMNGSLTEQISLLEQISQKNAENFLNENKKSIDKAAQEMEKNRHTYLGKFYDDGSDESNAVKQTVKDLQDKYGEDVFQMDEYADGFTVDIQFNADAAQAKDALNDFMTEISDIEDKYGESDTLEVMSNNAYSGLKSAKDVLGEYQDLYDQAQKAEMIADSTLYGTDEKKQTAAKWLKDYSKAVKEYNDAVADGDDLKIQDAEDTFSNLDSVMKRLSKESGMSEYADQIQEIRDQLNETAIANNKFTKAVKGNDSSKFGKKVAESAKSLKELKLSDTDFKYAFETEGVQEGEEAVHSLIDAALECGVISDTSSEQVSNLVSMLAQLGIISSDSINTATEAAFGLEKQLEDTKTALSGINAVTSILNSQGTGKSITIDDFNSDELADYTSALEYNNGALQLNAEKVRELQKAKAEEAIQTNDNLKLEKQSEYMQNIAEIEQLQDKLRGLSDVKGESAEKIQSNIDALLMENDSIVNQCNQLDLLSASLREATGAYQAWLDKQNASESGDMFDDAMGALQHIEDTTQITDSEFYGRTGREDYKAAVDFIVPDSIDHEDVNAVSSYIDSIEHYFNHDSDGKRTGLDVAEFCAKATKAGLMELDKASGEYKVAGQRTMQDFADGLNLSLPFVQAMFGEMEEFDAHFDWSDEAVKTLGDLGMAAGEAKSRIEELSGDKDLDIQIDVSDIENTEDKIATLDNTIQKMQDYKTTLDVDSSEVDDANTVIQYCVTQKQMLEAPSILSVDTSQVEGNLGNALSLLQQFQQAQNNVELQTAVGADTSEAQGKVDSLVSEIQGLSPEIQAQLNIDTASADTIEASLQALTPEIMVKAGVDSAVVDAYAAEEKKAEGTVKWKNNTGVVDAWAAQMHVSNGTVSWKNDISQVKTTFTATGTVNWTNTNAPTGGKHGVNGTAHAAGTAHYNHLVGHAYADGNWGTKTGGTTLVGELGREIVVDPGSGTWHTVGDNGAEFVNIPAGSIVFNHLQSEALLKRGFVNGRGTARANGTAMVRGGISSNQADIASHNTTYPGSHSSPSSTTPANTSAQQGNTNATNDNTKSTKKNTSAFDYVAQRLTYFANKTKAIADKITDYVSSAFKAKQLKRQINALNSEININTKGAKAYKEKADSIDLTAAEKKAVREGRYSITDYDTSSKGDNKTKYDKLNDYKKYYEEYVKCTQAVQELRNQQVELFEQWANIPIEEAEKKIERLKNGFKGLTAIQARLNVANLGGSAQALLKQEMDRNFNTAKSNFTQAKSKQKSAKTKYTNAVKEQKTAQAQSNKASKKLKTAKSRLQNTPGVTLTAEERKRMESGQSISTKGLTGKKKKLVQDYNVANKKSKDSKKKLNTAKSKTNKAKSDLRTANTNYTTSKSVYDTYSKQYKEMTKYMNSGDTLGYQNYLVDSEVANKKSQNQANQNAYREATKNRINTQKQKDAVDPKKIRAKAKENAKKTGASILKNKKFANQLTPAQKKALKNGTKVDTKGIKDKKLLKMIEDYNKALDEAAKRANASKAKYSQLAQELTVAQEKEAEAAANAAESEAEYVQAAIEAEQTKFNNISAYYDTRIEHEKAIAEKAEKARELASARGEYTKSEDFDSQIADVEKQKALQEEKVKRLQQQLNESVKSGTIIEGSEEWLKMKSEILGAESAVEDYGTQIENLKQQQITTKYEEMFDRAISKADKFISKLNSIDDLISDDMKYDSETGELTEFGALSIALNAKELDSQIENIKQYAQKRKQIMDDFANGEYGEQKYDELMAENDSNTQSAIKNASNYRDAIVKIITSQAQAVQDALFKVMDAHKKALQKKKEYFDYDKKLKNKTSEIQLIDQQIAALDGLADAESKAMKAKLEAQRKEKQEDLDDTVRDHVYDLQVNGLDDLKDQLSEDFEKWSKELTSNIDKATDVINNAVNSVGNNTAQVMDALGRILKAYGIEPSDVLTGSDLNRLDGYASGTKRVGGVPRLAMTNEKGREILVTKKGILTPVLPTDGVVPSDMTSTLMQMAMDYKGFKMPEVIMPNIEIVNKGESNGGDNISIHYDSLLTVKGDVTKDALPDLKTILKQASEYTQNDIRKNRRRFG